MTHPNTDALRLVPRRAVYDWLRDDVPLNVKMTVMPHHVDALLARLSAAAPASPLPEAVQFSGISGELNPELFAENAKKSEGALPDDVRRLVVAARIVAFEGVSAERIKELDKASEAFASRVPWENEPTAPSGGLA